mmetsp:Transcript_11705/g.27592  ORF Transcript_11705/g.27592 Transcript_11705/m.27592 type:complete len:205 (+) Transcript_11705:282-896(+)
MLNSAFCLMRTRCSLRSSSRQTGWIKPFRESSRTLLASPTEGCASARTTQLLILLLPPVRPTCVRAESCGNGCRRRTGATSSTAVMAAAISRGPSLCRQEGLCARAKTGRCTRSCSSGWPREARRGLPRASSCGRRRRSSLRASAPALALGPHERILASSQERCTRTHHDDARRAHLDSDLEVGMGSRGSLSSAGGGRGGWRGF